MSETPSKGDTESALPYQAKKDRACPFCNKPFTSSSLGRHLDLWIKDKNPKPEDGVHDVDEIRKMRGAVTRRQQKKSLGSRRDSSTSVATSAATPVAKSKRSPTAPEHVNLPSSSSLSRKDSAPAIRGFNVHNFAVTGVINNIETDSAHSTSSTAANIVTQQGKASQLNVDMAKKIQDAEDTARAAELALREMISSWRAAKLHIDMDSTPFDFQPLSLDFPALVLQCLQPPPTLPSSEPFPTETSWSILPPGEQQCTALRAYFSEEFRNWRIKCAAATTALQEDIQYPPSESAFRHDPQEVVRQVGKRADDQEKKINEHITMAYSRWEALPQHRRQDIWTLELARSIGKKQAQIVSMQEEQHRLRQENANLRSQIDQLNKLQQPREFKIMPPATLPAEQKFLDFWQEKAVVHGHRTVGMTLDGRHLDIGTVVATAIDRWKRVVVSHRPPGSAVLGKRTADQAGMNGDVNANTTQNKARALSNANDRPQPRPERGGPAGGASKVATQKPMPAASDSTAGEVMNGSNPGLQARKPETAEADITSGRDADAEQDDDLSDRDADAEQDDDLSDRDAIGERDDGMSDQDAEAEPEEDDALGYSHMNNVAAMPRTGPSGPRQQLAGPSSLPSSAQPQTPVPQTRHNGGSVGAVAGINGGGPEAQPARGSVRHLIPIGIARTSVSQHSK